MLALIRIGSGFVSYALPLNDRSRAMIPSHPSEVEHRKLSTEQGSGREVIYALERSTDQSVHQRSPGAAGSSECNCPNS
jgi:hypothetical protein